MVEVTGLEPTTSWSLTKRATKLRHTSEYSVQREGRSTTSWSLRRRGRLRSHIARWGNARVRAPLLLFPKISLALLAAIFGSPLRARCQYFATPRNIQFNGQVVSRPLGPCVVAVGCVLALPDGAMLACALRSSFSQKSRSHCSLRFSGALSVRATKLRHTSIVFYLRLFRDFSERAANTSPDLEKRLCRFALRIGVCPSRKQHNLLYNFFGKSKTISRWFSNFSRKTILMFRHM